VRVLFYSFMPAQWKGGRRWFIRAGLALYIEQPGPICALAACLFGKEFAYKLDSGRRGFPIKVNRLLIFDYVWVV